MRANWSIEETELLKQVYSLKTANELAEIFPNYNNTQILRKAKQLKLKKKKEVVYRSRLENSIIQRNDLWSDEEKRAIIEHYSTKGASGVREELNDSRSEEQIKKMAYRMGLNREDKSLMWEQSQLSVKKGSNFSIEVVFKGR